MTPSLARRQIKLRAEKQLEDNETRDSAIGNQPPPSPNLSPRIAQTRAIQGRGENWLER